MATVSKQTYYKTSAALFVLLVLTVAVAYIPLGPFAVPVTLTIATAKAALVVAYFMHVRYQPQLVWIFAVAGFIWLLILLGLTFSDYLTRDWLPVTTWDPAGFEASPE